MTERHSKLSGPIQRYGEISVRTITSQEILRSILDMQTTFGGDAYARIEHGDLGGQHGYLVTVRYTSYRATVGFLDKTDVAALRWPLVWLRLRRRAARCPARIVSDEESPLYLDVELNPVGARPSGAGQGCDDVPRR